MPAPLSFLGEVTIRSHLPFRTSLEYGDKVFLTWGM